ncbi:hypothetical protein ACHAWU_007304 [Discostella pseudostelligera]|uniref:SD-repeat containing protein B domain-containing protein n=1 Tax=Discostella pseudostelligera TaxID=259834 RepID=A0ABD3N0U5_9STRA
MNEDDEDVTTFTSNSSQNLCKDTADPNYLYPGEIISRGEFLCRGDLRFGIDATHGYFMVGFLNWTELAIISSSSSSTNYSNEMNEEDIIDGEDQETDDENNNIAEGAPWDVVTPTSLAWRAIPTTLFTPITRPFAYLNLTEAGNILGYDEDGNEIYDSNYDDNNRLESKRGNSRLIISGNCWHVTNIDVEEGEMCVKLTSPPRAGMPYGTDTWGIRVHPTKIVPVEPLIPPTMAPTTMTPSSVSPTAITSSLPPVSVSTLGVFAAQPSTSMPTYSSSSTSSVVSSNSPSPFGSSGLASSAVSNSTTTESIGDAPTFHPSQNLIVEEEGNFWEMDGQSTHIWGKVWLDSNRDGEINVGETTINGINVTLFECSEEEDEEEDEGSDSMEVPPLTTDSEGMYFLTVPTGRAYRVKFESNPDEYGFSSGIDTHTDESGWTECKSSNNLQWNAGLFFLNDTSYEEDSASDNSVANDDMIEEKSSIGGHIYLDTDKNGNMEPDERTAAVGGYTVNNAKIVISLTDCMTYEVTETLEKRFPCTYSFGNLTEGSYKLRYEIQGVTRANTPNAVSLYSIIGNDGNSSSVYETSCGKLGNGEDIDSGDVGVRSLAITPYAAASPTDPLAFADLAEKEKSTEGANASTLSLEGEGPTSGGGTNSFIPALVGAFVTLGIVAAVAAIFVKRRHGDLASFPYLGSGKAESVAVRSLGSNDLGAGSLVSGASNTHKSAIGSIIIEAGAGKCDGTTQKSTIDELPEEESVGFEVYDDEEDGLQGSVDYGPVISDMIAKYSEKQSQNEEPRTTGDESDSGPTQQSVQKGGHEDHGSAFNTSPARSKKYSPQRHASQLAPSNIEIALIPGNAQTYSNQIYDASQYQYSSSGYIVQDGETVTSGSSRSTDPPAASYRDIPAPQVGWNRDIQLVGDFRQYETPPQYVAGNDVHTASYVSSSNDEGIHQIMNHDTYIDYSAVDSGNSAGQGSSSGWSGFSSAPNPLAMTGVSSPFKRSYNVSGSPKRISRRAQSNPRDGQSSERWRLKPIVTPAHSTVEYNAYSVADQSNEGVVSADDDKSAHTLGSDQSSDPPGASYMNLTQFPPPVPPHRMTPPRKFSPNTSPTPPPRSYPSLSSPARSYPSPPFPPR